MKKVKVHKTQKEQKYKYKECTKNEMCTNHKKYNKDNKDKKYRECANPKVQQGQKVQRLHKTQKIQGQKVHQGQKVQRVHKRQS